MNNKLNTMTMILKFVIRVLVIIGTFGFLTLVIFQNNTPYWWFVITLPIEVFFVGKSYSLLEKEMQQ